MRKKIKYYFLTGTLFLCFFSLIFFNLNNSNISAGKFIDEKSLQLSQAAQLALNQKLKNQHTSQFDRPRYYITVPTGNIHVKVAWDSFWEMDLKLEVFSNQNSTNRLGLSDTGGTSERVDLTIEQAMTIYIEVSAKSGSGFFSIRVFNDAYIARQETKMITIIVAIVVGVLVVISAGFIIYKRNSRGISRWRHRVSPQNLYQQKQEESFQQTKKEIKGRNLVICSNCGNKTPRSNKYCKFCGNELNKL